MCSRLVIKKTNGNVLTRKEVRAAMKEGKMVVQRAGLWSCGVNRTVDFFTRLFNTVLESETSPSGTAAMTIE